MTVELANMALEDYDDYLAFAIKDYAKDKIEAGTWEKSEANALAEESFQTLLPSGIETPGEYLFSIWDTSKEQKIGFLWTHLERKQEGAKFFIYDFLIFEKYRNQGYGKKALACLDQKAKEMGIQEIGLHVFAHNRGAVHLYENTGYVPTDITMSKKIN